VINQFYFSIHVSIFVANCYRIELNSVSFICFVQVCSDQALEAVALLLLCHRDSLPVYNAMSRGSVVGHLTFNYKVLQTAGDRVFDDGEPRGFSYQIREKVLNIDARDSDIFGRDIPILFDKIACLNSKEALFILVVESKAILVSLYSVGFQQRFRCIIITGSGVPDVESQIFLRKTSLGLKLPVLALVDGDASGFKILTIYNKRGPRRWRAVTKV
jgi:DNA topoisomerase VI subunit A